VNARDSVESRNSLWCLPFQRASGKIRWTKSVG